MNELCPAARDAVVMLTEEALATELVMRRKTLAQWRYQGLGPKYVRLGRHVRYRRSDVDDWLEAQTRGGAG